MKTSNLILLDTNVLVYACDQSSSYYSVAKQRRDEGLKGTISLCITPQVLSEFFAIITDPRRVTQPCSQQMALQEIQKYCLSEQIVKIFPLSITLEIMTDLLSRYPITRQDIFDLQLAATMLSNGVTRLYTFNQKDFSIYQEIQVLPIP